MKTQLDFLDPCLVLRNLVMLSDAEQDQQMKNKKIAGKFCHVQAEVIHNFEETNLLNHYQSKFHLFKFSVSYF